MAFQPQTSESELVIELSLTARSHDCRAQRHDN